VSRGASAFRIPPLLAIAGAALAFVPAGPELEIEPDWALALFVAPVLLDAAFDTSPRDLRRNVIPLASLVVVAVGLTTAAVAWVGWRLEGLPIAAAVALGAIVARRMPQLPRRFSVGCACRGGSCTCSRERAS
jgi:monovalent cation/hydrogen antiporter